MKHITLALASLVAIIGLTVFAPSYAGASTVSDTIGQGVGQAGGSDPGNNVPLGTRVKTIVNVMLFILGAIAVIMIVVGGIRYTTSGGDASRVKGSKDTIMYAIVGLVIALLAYALVNFVIASFK
ncbi:MAG: pilin [Candidatus Saccharimonadales bacterium]